MAFTSPWSSCSSTPNLFWTPSFQMVVTSTPKERMSSSSAEEIPVMTASVHPCVMARSLSPTLSCCRDLLLVVEGTTHGHSGQGNYLIILGKAQKCSCFHQNLPYRLRAHRSCCSFRQWCVLRFDICYPLLIRAFLPDPREYSISTKDFVVDDDGKLKGLNTGAQ